MTGRRRRHGQRRGLRLRSLGSGSLRGLRFGKLRLVPQAHRIGGVPSTRVDEIVFGVARLDSDGLLRSGRRDLRRRRRARTECRRRRSSRWLRRSSRVRQRRFRWCPWPRRCCRRARSSSSVVAHIFSVTDPGAKRHRLECPRSFCGPEYLQLEATAASHKVVLDGGAHASLAERALARFSCGRARQGARDAYSLVSHTRVVGSSPRVGAEPWKA